MTIQINTSLEVYERIFAVEFWMCHVFFSVLNKLVYHERPLIVCSLIKNNILFNIMF